ncbi:hypothetical protein [Candidatus Enterovibrio altilux]|nr:hypothetical protein [Candidatus Enterovibrio luxaltus]
MIRAKKLLVETLGLRNHTTQIKETYVIIKVLHKLTVLGMLKIKVVINR